MQRAGQPRGTRAHNQDVCVQPLSFDRHALILARQKPQIAETIERANRFGYSLGRLRSAASCGTGFSGFDQL